MKVAPRELVSLGRYPVDSVKGPGPILQRPLPNVAIKGRNAEAITGRCVLVFVPPGGFYRSCPGVPFLVKITVCCVTHIDLQLRVRAGSRLQLSPHLHGL